MVAKLFPIGYGPGASCDNCGITSPNVETVCEYSCPTEAIQAPYIDSSSKDGTIRYVADDYCIDCGICMSVCPVEQGAVIPWIITADHPLGSLTYDNRGYVGIGTFNSSFTPQPSGEYDVKIYTANGDIICDGYSNMLRHHETVTFSFQGSGWGESLIDIAITPSVESLICFIADTSYISFVYAHAILNADTNLYDMVRVGVQDFQHGTKTISGIIHVMKKD